MSAEHVNEAAREWMPGGGVIADRTNELIAEILHALEEHGEDTITVDAIDAIAVRVLPVGHRDTIEDYRIRAVRFGPFTVDTPGKATLTDAAALEDADG